MSGDYSMMTLGSFTFEVATAAYQEFKRSTEYLWPSQQRFGTSPVVQGVGLGDDTITLSGVVYPQWNGGIGQLDRLREIAEAMEPLNMIGGLGNIMGKWVIERVDETGSIFAQAGIARKQEFSMTLKKSSDEGADGVLSAIRISAPVAAKGTPGLPAIPATLSPLSSAAALVSTVTATANAALSTATRVAGQVGLAVSKVAAISNALGIHSTALNKALNRSQVVLNGIRKTSGDGLDVLRRVQTVGSAATTIKAVYDDVSSMVQPAAAASKDAKNTLAALVSSGASSEAISVAKGALVAVNQAAQLASSLRDSANTIIKKIGGT